MFFTIFLKIKLQKLYDLLSIDKSVGNNDLNLLVKKTELVQTLLAPTPDY